MKTRFYRLALTIILATLGSAAAHAEVKADSLRFLQDLRSENTKRLNEIRNSVSEKLENSNSKDLEKDIALLKGAQHEYALRQDFLNRLIFQIDTKFHGGDLRKFLTVSLVEMAKVDALSQDGASGTVHTGLWKFLKYSSDAIRRLPEQGENALAFLEGYMVRSVANPVTPDEYLNSRNYTNGSISEAGNPLSREDVGAIADRRTEDLKRLTPSVPVKQ